MKNYYQQALSLMNLRIAWNNVASNKGSAGADGITIENWKRDEEANLIAIRKQVYANAYQPVPLKRFKVPKKSGGLREFAIPSIRDRVLQRAVLQVLDDDFERIFLPSSFGYRQGKGIRNAVAKIVELRDAGYLYVLDADIDECFPNIDHDILLTSIRHYIHDRIILRLIEQWLSGMSKNGRGLSLGGVISPLLCNIYLHHLDSRLYETGWYSVVRYADDFCIFCKSMQDAVKAYHQTSEILTEINMIFEPSKTQITSFEEGFDYLGVRFKDSQFEFNWKNARVVVTTPSTTLPVNWLPKDYEQWERST